MGRVCTYFALFRTMQLNSKIETHPIKTETTLKRNFTFLQLIDENVHGPDNGLCARVIALGPRARCTG